MPNRLGSETSPYLLQHKDNPVDWYPWGPEAMAAAALLDKPILLSVGYSACHWCHVMERESFEDPQIAALMNELFVNIKVDREERPDVDSVYMSAVQAMTGHGGWPMTVFLTPEGRPFYGGTYYPPEDRGGMPSFPRVLHSVAQAYRTRRGGPAGQLEPGSSATFRLKARRGEGSGRWTTNSSITASWVWSTTQTARTVGSGFSRSSLSLWSTSSCFAIGRRPTPRMGWGS